MKLYHYDPVCGQKLNRGKAYKVIKYDNEEYLVCCPECQNTFESNILEFMEKARASENRKQRRIRIK